MKKMFKPVIAAALIIISVFLMYIQLISNSFQGRLLNLLAPKPMDLFAFSIIILFLFYKVYEELSKEDVVRRSYLKVLLLLLIPVMIVINVITDTPLTNNTYVQQLIIFRIICILLLIHIIDIRFNKPDFTKGKIIITCFAFVLSSLTFMLDTSTIVIGVSFYYSMSIVFFMYLLMINRIEDKTVFLYLFENSTYIFISLALLNDILVLATDMVHIELLFISVGINIVIGIMIKIAVKFSYYLSLESSKNDYEKNYLEILEEKKKNDLSVEKLKSDLSYKFMEKQNYFENLELVLEVSDISIIMIGSDFKIELAHGMILELSGIEDMVGVDISKAIFDVSSEEGLYFKSVVRKIFDATDEIRESLYISLLDKNLKINNYTFDLKYDVVHKRNGVKVLILRAIKTSDSNRQSILLAQDKELSDMVISIVKNSELFFSDLSSYLEFCKNITKCIDSNLEIGENIFRILRRVHTYKGVFDQYNMATFIQGLNDIENELLNMLQNVEMLSNDQFERIVKEYELEELLDSDLAIINQRLGDSFLNNRNRAFIDLTDFNRVFRKLKVRLDENGDEQILRELEILKEVDVADVLLAYKQYIDRIASEQGKIVDYFVSGDNVTVSRSRHVNFFEGLIHILKNIVAHGIEYPDERRAYGKTEVGTIKCEIRVLNNRIHLNISDDGRGIDVKEIRNSLFILGKYSIEQLEELSDSEVCNMIIEDGITSQSMPNSLAGRGVGMGSIREIVQDINGTINVISAPQKGVVYEITIPLKENDCEENFDYESVLTSLCIQAERILTRDEKKSRISSTWDIDDDKISYDNLFDCTVKVAVRGHHDVNVLITADENFLMHLIHSYDLQLKYKGSNVRVINEALSTFAYDIVGKSSLELKDIRETVKVLSPILMSKQLIESDFSGYKTKFASLDINEGRFKIMVIEGIRVETL